MGIKFDDKDFQKKSKRFRKEFKDKTKKAVNKVADEILRLSQFEVPHDKGSLQNSGHVESQGPFSAIVGYNKVYAARLHEHPEFNFQKGRKGKYLEDPIKKNIRVLKDFLVNEVKL